MLHKGADHTTIAMHDQPARKPLSSSVNRVRPRKEKAYKRIWAAAKRAKNPESQREANPKYRAAHLESVREKNRELARSARWVQAD